MKRGSWKNSVPYHHRRRAKVYITFEQRLALAANLLIGIKPKMFSAHKINSQTVDDAAAWLKKRTRLDLEIKSTAGRDLYALLNFMGTPQGFDFWSAAHSILMKMSVDYLDQSARGAKSISHSTACPICGKQGFHENTCPKGFHP